MEEGRRLGWRVQQQIDDKVLWYHLRIKIKSTCWGASQVAVELPANVRDKTHCSKKELSERVQQPTPVSLLCRILRQRTWWATVCRVAQS